MSRSVQRPPIQGRGYSVRGLMSVGGGSGAASRRRVRRRGRLAGRRAGRPARARRTARCCSIGAATRALATSVSRPIWLCHQPLHAIAPCQKLV